MQESFINALIGGALLGLASGILLVMNGRIAGISGIFGGAINFATDKDWQERALFVFGLLLSPLVYGLFRPLPEIVITNNIALVIFAGLLVGFGSRLGSGCTSGHGILGLGRQSPRSLAAVITFMAIAVVTVFIQNHLLASLFGGN